MVNRHVLTGYFDNHFIVAIVFHATRENFEDMLPLFVSCHIKLCILGFLTNGRTKQDTLKVHYVVWGKKYSSKAESLH